MIDLDLFERNQIDELRVCGLFAIANRAFHLMFSFDIFMFLTFSYRDISINNLTRDAEGIASHEFVQESKFAASQGLVCRRIETLHCDAVRDCRFDCDLVATFLII
jgi:hypothetical protein